MTTRCFLILAMLFVGLWGPSSARAQEELPPLLPESLAWAGFKNGAWKKVRVITDTLDADSVVTDTATTEMTTVLAGCHDQGYKLQTTVTVEVAGKRFDAAPQVVDQTIPNKGAGQGPFKLTGSETLKLDDKPIDCKVFNVTTIDGGEKQETTVYVSHESAPPILKRRIVSIDPTTNKTLSESVETVEETDVPFKINGESLSTLRRRTVRITPKGTTTIISLECAEMPGAIVQQTSTESDKAGRTVRQTSLEVVDFGLSPNPILAPLEVPAPKRGIFRKRNRE